MDRVGSPELASLINDFLSWTCGARRTRMLNLDPCRAADRHAHRPHSCVVCRRRGGHDRGAGQDGPQTSVRHLWRCPPVH